MKVGFIGVGNMGGPMCRNIVKRSNHQVTVFDLNAAAVKTCTDLGATAAASIAEATRGADVVMTSLPMPKDVEAVTLGDGDDVLGSEPLVGFPVGAGGDGELVATVGGDEGGDALGVPAHDELGRVHGHDGSVPS